MTIAATLENPQSATVTFVPIPTLAARHLQAGGADAYGLLPERRVSDGGAGPCRHCLRDIAFGRAYLTLAYRPFPVLQPYAETGPVFLCADPCAAMAPAAILPDALAAPQYILRGYGPDDRIVYGTGHVVPRADISAAAARLLARTDIAYAHLRSASNNCYLLRAEATEPRG